MTQWSHEVSINLTFGMYLQYLVHVIPRVFYKYREILN